MMRPSKDRQRRGADEHVVARLVIGGNHFEVLVEPNAVQALKDGHEVDLRESLAQDHIFKDAKKGDKISEEFLQKEFKTDDIYAIAKEIILKGEVQVTTDQRRAMVETKRRQIVDYISRNAINPQTGAPHPPQRIEAAMEEAKCHIDPFRSLESQTEEVLGKLRPLLPIRLEKVKVRVKVPAALYPKVIGELKGMGAMSGEDWAADGTWNVVVEIPGGLQTDLLERIRAKTKGQAETSVVKGT